MVACGLLLIAKLAPALSSRTQDELELQFIGHAAFRITDGQTTLVTDFPYRSGYAGSMTYRLEDVGPLVDGVSLVTHEHADHWDPSLFRKMSLKVIAAPGLTRRLPADRVIAWNDDAITFKDVRVHPIVTPHTPNHRSYLVVWHGVRMFFTGDTEDSSALVAARDLDAAFVTPWLIDSLIRTGARLDAKLLVVYHHTDREEIPQLPRMVRPRQGDTFRLDYR